VFALKPTFGAVPIAGAKPFAPSLDTIGWFARSADDLELMRCALMQQPYAPQQAPPASSLRLGLLRTHEDAQLEAAATWDDAQRRVSSGGIALQRIAMPDTLGGLLEAQKTVMAFEAARSLDMEWRLHREQLGAALVALLETGRGIAEDGYRAALDLAARARTIVDDLMRDVDALMVPSAPGEAPRGLAATGDPVFNRVWTLLGLPCVNVPGLRGPEAMPVGVQVVGRRGQDARLLAVASQVQRTLAAWE